MESCLTLVRSFYGSQEKMVSAFSDEHPTKDKQRLLSKILAQMMIRCNANIAEDQVKLLQDYKTDPNKFDYKKDTYA